MTFSNKFQLQISSSNNSTLQKFYLLFIYILQKNKIINLKISKNYLPLHVKKFTVLKAPHVFKKARTQLEIRTLKNVITITNFSMFQETTKLHNILNNLIKNLPSTTRLKIKIFKLIYI
jgi:ribosomal protein S10